MNEREDVTEENEGGGGQENLDRRLKGQLCNLKKVGGRKSWDSWGLVGNTRVCGSL